MPNNHELYRFVEQSRGFDIRDKIKLVLFFVGVKRNAFVRLKIHELSLGEKWRFEQLLQKQSILFSAGREKSYEKIKKIAGNKIIWGLAGTWIGYDLFGNVGDKKKFVQYLALVKKGKHDEANRLAGALYGYPGCDIAYFLKEEKSPPLIRKRHSCYGYYLQQRLLDVRFPWVFHRAHALGCKKTAKMNKTYRDTLQKYAPGLLAQYAKERTFKTDIILMGESDVLHKGKTIWPKKDGREYGVVTARPLEGKYWLLPFLTKKRHQKGQVLEARVALRYNYATIKVIKEKRAIKGMEYKRKLPLLGNV